MGPQPLILLLEDEPFIAIDVETALRSAGFAVETLRSCADGERYIERTVPDLAIVDINLRDGPCHDLAAKLHEAGIPFIVHTGYARTDYADSVFEKGLWLAKPTHQGMIVSAAIRAMKAGPISDGEA